MADEGNDTMALMPVTGEVINLDDPNQCARAYDTLAEIERQVRTAKQAVAQALIDYRTRSGSGATFRVEAAEVKISEPSDISWNMEVLSELLQAGLPDARWQELVTRTVDTKVSATVARQIGKANPVYAEIVERAQTRTPKRPTVTVALRAETL